LKYNFCNVKINFGRRFAMNWIAVTSSLAGDVFGVAFCKKSWPETGPRGVER